MSKAASDINDATLPFLKWAGGKRWLTNNYVRLFPDDFNNYIEPFLGSGAVFFHLRPQQSILSDKNADLSNRLGLGARNRNWLICE